MVNTNYTTGSLLGAKLNNVSATAEFALGTQTTGNNGSIWMYCQASNSITQYDAVTIQSDYKMGQLTIDKAKEPLAAVGFAQVAFADKDYYGWVMISGKPLVRLAADCEPSVPIYATATGGVVDDAVVSAMIQGMIATTSVTGTTVAATCIANFPHITRGAVL